MTGAIKTKKIKTGREMSSKSKEAETYKTRYNFDIYACYKFSYQVPGKG
jgi:hypothetical protein